MRKVNLQRQSLDNLIRRWNFHTEAIELATSTGRVSQQDELARQEIENELQARGFVPKLMHRQEG